MTRSVPRSPTAPSRNSQVSRWQNDRERGATTDIDDAFRFQVVLRALRGEWVDPGELGYDLAGQHVAVVGDDSSLLDATARRTNRPLLRVQTCDGATWEWLGGSTRISDDDLDALIASHGSSDVMVAFGEPAEGIAGFASSHRQACEAKAIAVATDQRAVRFADFRVLIAVLRDRDLARGLIAAELGELDRPGKRMRELRDTLRAYLEHGQSVSATAAWRGRSRKTIERHLRSAEELIHHRVSERTDEVLIALRVAEILRDVAS